MIRQPEKFGHCIPLHPHFATICLLVKSPFFLFSQIHYPMPSPTPKSPNPRYLKALPRELLSPSPSALGRLLPQDPVGFLGLPSQVMLLGTGHGHCLAGNDIHKSLKSACICVCIYIYIYYADIIHIRLYICMQVHIIYMYIPLYTL